MRQHDALGVARGARGELHQRQIGVGHAGVLEAARAGLERRRLDDRRSGAGLVGRGLDHQAHLGERHDQGRGGHLDQPGQALLVVLEALGAQGRVAGHGDGADQLAGVKQRHELDARRQHHQHPIAYLDAARLQGARHR
ncbi:hypothetical protein D3C72_1801850 [compost metagenome]